MPKSAQEKARKVALKAALAPEAVAGVTRADWEAMSSRVKRIYRQAHGLAVDADPVFIPGNPRPAAAAVDLFVGAAPARVAAGAPAAAAGRFGAAAAVDPWEEAFRPKLPAAPEDPVMAAALRLANERGVNAQSGDAALHGILEAAGVPNRADWIRKTAGLKLLLARHQELPKVGMAAAAGRYVPGRPAAAIPENPILAGALRLAREQGINVDAGDAKLREALYAGGARVPAEQIALIPQLKELLRVPAIPQAGMAAAAGRVGAAPARAAAAGRVGDLPGAIDQTEWNFMGSRAKKAYLKKHNLPEDVDPPFKGAIPAAAARDADLFAEGEAGGFGAPARGAGAPLARGRVDPVERAHAHERQAKMQAFGLPGRLKPAPVMRDLDKELGKRARQDERAYAQQIDTLKERLRERFNPEKELEKFDREHAGQLHQLNGQINDILGFDAEEMGMSNADIAAAYPAAAPLLEQKQRLQANYERALHEKQAEIAQYPARYKAAKHEDRAAIDEQFAQRFAQGQEGLRREIQNEQAQYGEEAAAHEAEREEYKYLKWAKKNGKDVALPATRALYDKHVEAKGMTPFEGFKKAQVDATQTQAGPVYLQQATKGVIERAIDVANRKHQAYNKSRFAEAPDEELEAERLIDESNPARSKKQHKALEERYRKTAETPSASLAAKPYLKKADRNSLDFYRDHANSYEDDVVAALRDRGNRTFKEDVLPDILAKYSRPGLRRHGHIGKETARATEAYSRGLNEAIAGVKSQGHREALHAAHAEKHSALQNAQTASQTAALDSERSLVGTRFLDESLRKRREDIYHHAGHKANVGAAKREREQAKHDWDYEKFVEAREHPKTSLGFLSNTVARHPQSAGTYGMSAEAKAPMRQQNLSTTVGAGLVGMGRQALGLKKGGTVNKKRLKRATGGIISQALENAMLEHDDPLDSLNRLMKHNIGIEMLEKKARARKAYKDGGEVNPIAKGAAQAKHYALQDEMLAHAHKMMNPEPQNPLIGAFDAFMEGAANSGSNDRKPNFLQRAGKASGAASNKLHEGRRAQHEKDMQALQIKSGVAKSRQQDEKDSRAHEFNLKQHADNLALKREALAEKRQHQAQKMDILRSKPSTMPLSKQQEAAFNKTQTINKAANDLERAVAEFEHFKSKVKTGPTMAGLVKSTPFGLGPELVSYGSKMFGRGVGSADDIKALQGASENLVGAAQRYDAAFGGSGGRGSVAELLTRKAGKPSEEQGEEFNTRNIEKLKLAVAEGKRATAHMHKLYNLPENDEEEIVIPKVDNSNSPHGNNVGSKLSPEEEAEIAALEAELGGH